MSTHADVATQLVATKIPPAVFGKACKDAVLYDDFTLLQRMLPGVEFSIDLTGINMRVLYGRCADGSTAAWEIGLAS